MQDAVSELTRLTRSIAVDDGLEDEDQDAFQRLSAETAQLYFAAPGAQFNPRAWFWVVFEGRQRGIFADWSMANEVIFGFSGNSHRKIRGWEAAVQVLTQHLWDLGFRAEESPRPSTPSSSRRTTSSTQATAPSTPSRAAKFARTQLAAPPTPSRAANCSRTQPAALPTPSRAASSRTQPGVPSPPFRAANPSHTMPRVPPKPSRAANSLPNSSSPTQRTAPLAYETVTPVSPELDLYVVAGGSEIAVFCDRGAAERRALEYQDHQDLHCYFRTARLGAMLDAVEKWAWDNAGN
ncbi:hypothetical protein MSAN_01213400 [Mycena sanguinolenta]|uniref:Ribonuclease H1 N-terminal domain-containing protein n=1 Tax=Mycena sanguinolenta TaxID=230812 RepID=A0A8H6YI99_9AGAR|nr:hypothetical protein MSAN_01213400 [Mycena sanguinolenta]